MDKYMREAIVEAEKSYEEGGIPIGAVLVHDGKIISRGHNRRVQDGSPVFHAEMDCLENAGRLSSEEYRNCVLYSTLSPCSMCTGAVLLYRIPKVVMGENDTFKGPEDHLREQGVEVVNMDLMECKNLMKQFIDESPELWDEDIGE